MAVASWRQSEHRANRLIKGIILILITAVAIGVLVAATLALVGLEHVSLLTWLDESSMWISNVTERHAQSDPVGSAVACAYVAVCATMNDSKRKDRVVVLIGLFFILAAAVVAVLLTFFTNFSRSW